eukprot:CAMPEP_0197827374 /NCGR_PEP_ID=MMETSP1437-20131217/4162_1 /TAXON_ID=49252 ORGANISM="Eucampia antarctica, Strain CCMP1452" /NCGR_SAMPLE_ID=MMETSP1437 /ASSEMBLY_ACC=CAM_ASM_001096 /LENGTH=419 /DNA_ID=CAMNT_0043428191 /DNA_START=105 /DNA_END=1360 /DNA_ORIENTATION=+
MSRRVSVVAWTAVRRQTTKYPNTHRNRRLEAPKKTTRSQYPSRFNSRPNDYSLKSSSNNNNNDNNNRSSNSGSKGEADKNFRDDFRGTRVYVEGIPDWADWKLLKDHFRVAGEVVFASVSVDRNTGAPKGCGIVQYETTEMAQRAIKIMRDNPIDEKTSLYVRPDYQEPSSKSRSLRDNNRNNNNNINDNSKSYRPSAPSTWRCANPDLVTDNGTTTKMMEQVQRLIQERDVARRQKDYKKSDNIRQELKVNLNVQVDDRLKAWWVGNEVPESVMETKEEEGRWGKRKTLWRQIPTSPEQDANVDGKLVQQLLTERDVARKKKDFKLADELLEKAKTTCYTGDDDITLLIHDDDRTFRVWTKEKPTFSRNSYNDNEGSQSSSYSSKPEPKSATEQCLELIEKYNPEKKEEVTNLLERFP